MTSRNSIVAMKEDLTAARRELHQNPQTSYEETFASNLIAENLTKWGVRHERGWAGGTGIVAIIEGETNTSGRAIGLRCDIDALDIIEQSGQPWASKTPGKMHGCGHDGHTTMMLGAAKYLQENRNNFDGTVILIFQPAEEGERGADRMIEEGLFTKHPVDEIYGLHNWPDLPRGQIAMNPGPIMAAVDMFDIQITGRGGHAAMPHQTIDPAIISSHLILALQALISRETAPVDAAVISVTNIKVGTGAFNVIGDSATLSGTVRTFNPATRDRLEQRIGEVCLNIGAAFGGTCTFKLKRGSDATVNYPEQTAYCAEVARALVGAENVNDNVAPCMGGEDFGAMLKLIPGCYIWMGQAEPARPDCPHNKGLHHPGYDFNDEIIPLGVEYWARLVESRLPKKN
ncbi:MAG: amidohydrolase [Rhodospirillales bacterium]|nr:amidohydrolase [Rhodospirillales bacterium]MCB9965666.1 amidohydrolase [Rhodospirillales bacterium]MCB9973092.1 amidohydrolase [Rhodospirillales bacterium]